MAKCNNCGKALGCSCKVRAAENGKSCCATCVVSVNAALKAAKKTNNTTNPVGTILNAKAVQNK